LDVRQGALVAISPVSAGLRGARSALTIRREWTEKKAPHQPGKSHTRHFLSSLAPSQKKRVQDAARGHGSVENRNHPKRDASAWREDGHRHRKANGALNLALTRNVLLAMIPFEEGEPLDQCFEIYRRHPSRDLHLILGARPAL
jgi:hypothetical protein